MEDLCYSEDRMPLPQQSQRVLDEERGLMAPATVSRTGIYTYRVRDLMMACGQDAFPGRRPEEMVKLYRPEEEVGDVASLRSYEHAPVTLGHPDPVAYPQGVTPDCWAQLAKGHASDCSFDKKTGHVNVMLRARDAKAIAAINSGVEELSPGLKYKLDRTAGIDPVTGQAYDGVQRMLRVNHIAIVPSGRGGPECRVADEDTQPEGKPMKRNVQVKGVAYSLDETEASLVEALVKDLATAQDALTTAQTSHAKAIADLTADFTEKNKALQAQVKTPEQIAAMVQDHATVLDQCAKHCPKLERKGSALDIRRAMLGEITGKNAFAKKIADSVLVGVALDKADEAQVKVALETVLTATANDELTQRREHQARSLANPEVRGEPRATSTQQQGEPAEFSWEAAQRQPTKRQ